MNFEKPVIVYTAADNIEVHLIVDMLETNGVPAHAIEDQSLAGLWIGGTIGQIHKPNVWVDESTVEKAAHLIQDFEQRRRARIDLDGTTQECSHCFAFIDVGELPWEDDFGVPDDE
jgi:hypothetical protein